MNTKLDKTMLDAFSVSMKIGLVATIDSENEPHITVLSTLQGKNDNTMMLGKFVEGLSKQFFVSRPQTGFLIMNPEKQFWYGTMLYDSSRKEGEDYVMYNNQPLYRYNSYFGINTVYYFNLQEISEGRFLPMGNIISNAIKVMIKKGSFKQKHSEVMHPWVKKFTAALGTLKFVSFINDKGYPEIIPIIQSQSVGSNRIVIKNAPFTDRLNALVPNQKIAILAFSMSMENILLKGSFSGFNQSGYGYMTVERVYNSMPPVHKYIYPNNDNKEVTF